MRRLLAVCGIAALTVVIAATPASAHGLGGRTDLPLPAWQLAWAAGFAVAISFVALGTFWSEPRLAHAAVGHRILDPRGAVVRVLAAMAKVVGVFLFVVVLWAAWFGNENGAVNIAGVAFLIWFWVGLQVVSFLVGDIYRLFNPLVTIADSAAWLKAKATGSELSTVSDERHNLWPAVAAIFSFVWFELAYHSPGAPRSVAVFLTIYSIAMLGGAAVRGRSWVRQADGFAILFSILGALAPFFRGDDGNLRLRAPLAGLNRLGVVAGTVPFVLVVLGSTTFDGFTRSSLWADLSGARAGWSKTVASTIGLLVVIGVVSMIYSLAISWMAEITKERPADLSRAFGPTLVPIAAAYSIAHYFSFLFLNGQELIIRVSDPAGRGWDLFGTTDYAIDWTLVSPATIAWVQTLGIAVGHVLAVAAAHDLAIGRYPHRVAVRSQYPMLGVMISYTVLGLFLLLGG